MDPARDAEAAHSTPGSTGTTGNAYRPIVYPGVVEVRPEAGGEGGFVYHGAGDGHHAEFAPPEAFQER